MVDENEKKYRELNRLIFLTILETLRGDDDDESNFFQFLRLQLKTFPELSDWLSKKTEIYTRHDVQNEIINLMSNQIMRNLLEPVRSCIFSVMYNEYTEVSNKEQLTFCMRWLNNDPEVSVTKKSTCEFIKDPSNPRKRKSPNYSTIHLADGTTREAHHFYPTTCQDRYRVTYYNVLDTVVTSLKDQFNQPSFVVSENIESLLLKTIKGENTSDESEYILKNEYIMKK